LGLDAGTYNARLSGKTVLLTDIPGASSSSSLVAGRKRNKGDDKARAETRAAQEAARTPLGRKKRKHLAATSAKTEIE
jgi:hypothetical protein